MSVPLDQPHYGIGPAGMVRFLRTYAAFRGRASRSEFWWGQLTLFLAATVLTAPGLVVYVIGGVEYVRQAIESPYSTTGMDPSIEPLLPGIGLLLLGSAANLAFLVPQLALCWRRLQDAGLHGGLAFAFICGGWALGSVVPFVGFAFLVPGVLPSSLRSARFERSETPVLPPTIDAATWHLTRSWVRAGTAAAAPQPWPAQQWPSAQQWPAQQWPSAQQWPTPVWLEQAWRQQAWTHVGWQHAGDQPTSPGAGSYADPIR